MKNLSFLGFDKYCACSTGKIYSLRSNTYLKSVVQRNGYCQVTMSQDGYRKNFSVHRLIAMAYFGTDDADLVVNHKDGNKQNNRLDNLEFVTQKENVHHAIMIGLRVGTRNPDRELSDEVVHIVCKLLQDSWRNTDIADALSIKREVVANIRYGSIYQEISCEYDFNNVLPSRRKLSTEKLVGICEMLQDKKSYSEICKKYDVSSVTVHKIKYRKSGIFISKNYNF